jgi:signal transduction histidine kinase
MSLKQVFDELSDGVLIVNQDGDISYFNQPASQIIGGETIDTLGLGALQRMMRLVLNGELSTPIRFIEKTESGAEYTVKILTMYSFFVVQFVELKRPSDFQELKSNAIRMVNDKLGKKLQLLSDNLEVIKLNQNLDKTAAQPDLISNTISLIHSLSLSISELEHLAELYLKKPIESYSTVAPVSLLKSALSQVEANCHKKGINVKIRKRRTSPVKFFCNAPWMKMAVSECLLKLIDISERNSTILLKMDLHGHFLSIIIERAPALSDNGQLDDEIWIDYPIRANLNTGQMQNSTNFDLLLAERVISLHGGTLKVMHTDDGERFIIELPIGYEPNLDMMSADEQLRIYAEDLAKLQARQSRLKVV